MHVFTELLTLVWGGITEVPAILVKANPWVLTLLLLAATSWVGAASWGAAVAEKRRLPPVRHFLWGLLLPFAYPFVFVAEGKAKAETAAPATAVPPASPPASPSAAAPAATAAAPSETAPAASMPAADTELGFGPEFFERLRKEGWVTEANLCTIRFNGQEISASGILEALPEVVVVEIRQADGKPQRVRIPYARIEEVTGAGKAEDAAR